MGVPRRDRRGVLGLVQARPPTHST